MPRTSQKKKKEKKIQRTRFASSITLAQNECVSRMFWKGGTDEPKVSEGYSLSFATSHKQVSGAGEGGGGWGPCPHGDLGAFLSRPGARRRAVHPWRPGPGSVYALLRPAQLFGVRPLAAPDLMVVLQTPVQARHPRPPADEALGCLRDRGGREHLQRKRRGFVTLGHRHMRRVRGGIRTSRRGLRWRSQTAKPGSLCKARGPAGRTCGARPGSNARFSVPQC